MCHLQENSVYRNKQTGAQTWSWVNRVGLRTNVQKYMRMCMCLGMTLSQMAGWSLTKKNRKRGGSLDMLRRNTTLPGFSLVFQPGVAVSFHLQRGIQPDGSIPHNRSVG